MTLRYLLVGLLSLLFTTLLAQQKLVTGTVSDVSDHQPVAGVNIFPKGATTTGTVTDNSGNYSLMVPDGRDTLVFSHVGYSVMEEIIGARNVIEVNLVADVTALDEVVVVGYGTQAKRDLTGAVTSLTEKDFNRGNLTSPDQLIQGRVAGLQMTSNIGMPGGAYTIKIRGTSALTGTGQPLFVIDGVPLSGVTARPNHEDGFGVPPGGNPLNFINPADVASIEVLKDASATAIYGARAAYGVIIINTKKAQSGDPKIDINIATGFSSIFNEVKVLNAEQFRQAVPYYGVSESVIKPFDTDGLGSILRTGVQQNYNIAVTGGTENGKYRLSLGYLDQQGIIRKSELKKYMANFSTNLLFLESKKLGLDINITPSQYDEIVPPIRNNGGLLQDALRWNPTEYMIRGDGTPYVQPGVPNPFAVSEYFNDHSKVTTILGSLSPYFKFNDWFSMKLLLSVNYGSGGRRMSVDQRLIPDSGGLASIYNNESTTGQVTYTLNFQKDIFTDLNLNVVAGFEYMKFVNKGSSMRAQGPDGGFGDFGLNYSDYIQYSRASTRSISSFALPTSELQSYFGRAVVNFKSRYILTATLRRDGSSKFGDNNKYGFFPSFSAAWNIAGEGFLQSNFINALKLRVGWGKTGNQEFPAGSSQAVYAFYDNGVFGPANNPNPNLKWQTDEQANFGIDFAIFDNRITGTLDYFQKKTTDLLYPNFPIQPAPSSTTASWINLDGVISNKGLEATMSATLINSESVGLDVGFNAAFIENNVSGLSSEFMTGTLNGPGMSSVSVQIIKNGKPMNTFHTRKFKGFDDKGFGQYEDDGYTLYDLGSAIPTTILGLNTFVRFKKLSLAANMYGAFGHYIYNNILNAVIHVGNIGYGGNIALSNYQSPVKESPDNPVTASSRFIERGDYLKLGNVTLSYHLGSIGRAVSQTRLYVSGQNLFSITNYSGFDAEVNVDQSVRGVPSSGIDFQLYPTARTIMFGVNFRL